MKKKVQNMAKLTPNVVYTMNGVTVNEKIIPDGTRWKDATKAKKAGFSAGSLYKKQQKLSGGTGRVQSVTIHNTNDLANVHDDGEQYTRATYNENMNSSRVHFYVDDTGAWQNLKAGTGLCPSDPVGSAEVSWHSGDGSTASGGNMTSISMEIIMNETPEHDLIAKDNGARMAAWLLWKNGLTVDALLTHTYWVNKSAGKSFADKDVQCCNPIYGKKWCPTYIFGSNNAAVALKNWKAFKQTVKGYLDELNKATVAPPATKGLQAASLDGLSESQVIEKVGPLFTADQQKTGVLASVSLAQFLLESGYGRSELAKNANNCFGMKKNLSGNTWPGSTWDGKSVYTKQTKEQNTDGSYQTITADFRKYACVEDSIADHSAYLLGAKNGSNLRYKGLANEQDYKTAAQIIKNGGYATSLTYVDKLCNLIEQWNLTRFDVKKEVKEVRYNKIADMPKYAQATIIKMVDKGFIGGSGTAKDENDRPADLDLSIDMIRVFVTNDRAGVYGD